MSDQHRYSEKEIAAIFEQAAEAQEEAQSHLTHGEGLTIAELQQIGSEAGISPEFIARAAASMVGGSAKPKTTGLLGFPITVEHSVDLPGRLSDNDWDVLVADLRETFRASGKVSRNGSLREWRNGNLHVHVEPTKDAHRLRFRTTKGNAGQSVFIGSLFAAIGLIFLITRIVTGDLFANPDSFVLGMLALAGLTMIGLTRFTLPIWAKERGQQMGKVATRTLERMGSQTEEAVAGPITSPQIDLDALPNVESTEVDLMRDRNRV